jgi:hypothetical protein
MGNPFRLAVHHRRRMKKTAGSSFFWARTRAVLQRDAVQCRRVVLSAGCHDIDGTRHQGRGPGLHVSWPSERSAFEVLANGEHLFAAGASSDIQRKRAMPDGCGFSGRRAALLTTLARPMLWSN